VVKTKHRFGTSTLFYRFVIHYIGYIVTAW